VTVLLHNQRIFSLLPYILMQSYCFFTKNQNKKGIYFDFSVNID